VVPASDLRQKQEHAEKLLSRLNGQNTVTGVLVQPDVASGVNQEHEHVWQLILVVALVLDLQLKLEHVEKLLSQPDGQDMVPGVHAQSVVDQEVNQEHELVWLMILAVVPVSVRRLKSDLVELLSLIPNGDGMEHGVLALPDVAWELKPEHVLVLLVILVVPHALVHRLKRDPVEWRLLIPNGEVMENGVLALQDVAWELKPEHVLVLLVILVVPHALVHRLKRDLVEWRLLTPN